MFLFYEKSWEGKNIHALWKKNMQYYLSFVTVKAVWWLAVVFWDLLDVLFQFKRIKSSLNSHLIHVQL